jgi:DEAD/DEAH box helicase domain-containing protein
MLPSAPALGPASGRGLRWIVLDELHTYRGIFGSPRAARVFFLRAGCGASRRTSGPRPPRKYYCASATIGYPQALRDALFGMPFTTVSRSRVAPQARGHVVAASIPRDNAAGILSASLTYARCLRAGNQDESVLLQVPRRATAAPLQLDDRASIPSSAMWTSAPFRFPSYLAESNRREIEAALFGGRRARRQSRRARSSWASMSADSTPRSSSAYPGSIMSDSGSAGGRAGSRYVSLPGLFLVAGAGRARPVLHWQSRSAFFRGASPESAVVDAANPVIGRIPLACARGAEAAPLAADEPFLQRPRLARETRLDLQGRGLGSCKSASGEALVPLVAQPAS